MNQLSTIRQKEHELFFKWREQLNNENKIFIPDGVVDTDRWSDTSPRILFLLKEVNGGDTEWDERDYLAHYNTKEEYIKTHSPTITALIQWIHAFMTDSHHDWHTVEKKLEDKSLQSELLSQIALVNVKKTPGEGTFNGESFYNYWKNNENVQNLKEQLAIYSSSPTPPDFIVCGGTAWCYNEVFKDKRLVWQTTSRGITYCKHGQSIVVDYCHPQARIASNIKYYALYDAIQEILAQ